MKVGDLVRYKHFPEETAIVIKVNTVSNDPYSNVDKVEIDVLSTTGEVAICLDPAAFEVIK